MSDLLGNFSGEYDVFVVINNKILFSKRSNQAPFGTMRVKSRAGKPSVGRYCNINYLHHDQLSLTVRHMIVGVDETTTPARMILTEVSRINH